MYQALCPCARPGSGYEARDAAAGGLHPAKAYRRQQQPCQPSSHLPKPNSGFCQGERAP